MIDRQIFSKSMDELWTLAGYDEKNSNERRRFDMALARVIGYGKIKILEDVCSEDSFLKRAITCEVLKDFISQNLREMAA